MSVAELMAAEARAGRLEVAIHGALSEIRSAQRFARALARDPAADWRLDAIAERIDLAERTLTDALARGGRS
jgi:hypothetical protein